MHKLLKISLIAALMWGCKQEEAQEPTPVPPPPPPAQQTPLRNCQLTLETIEGRPFRNYQYVSDTVLYRIVQYETGATNREEKRYTFKYDAKNRVASFQEVRLLAPFVNYEYRFQYDNANRVEMVTQYQLFNAGPKLTETYVVQYGQNNRVYTYCWRNNCWRYEYDEAGNLSKWLATIPARSPNETTLRFYSNFDERKNVYEFSKPARLINLVSGEGNSTSNPGAFKFYEGSNEPTQTGVVTYRYNEQNLPVEASVSSFAANNGASITQVRKFTYDCP